MDRNASQQSGQKTGSILISQFPQIAVVERLLDHLNNDVIGVPMRIQIIQKRCSGTLSGFLVFFLYPPFFEFISNPPK